MYTPHVPEPSYVQAIYKMRQEEILDEVEQRRMLRLIRSTKQSFVERLMLTVGKSMIAMGERIRERYASVATQGYEYYSPRYKFTKLGYETSSKVNMQANPPHTARVFTEGRCSTYCDEVVQDIFSVPVNPSIRS
jgi:hypothetical protein